MNDALWFRDRQAWRLIARGYLLWLAALMLVWEAGHTPLYALWHEAKPAYIAFAIAHCTLGDLLIGGFALLLSLVVLRQGALARWQWERIAAATAVLGTTYTIFSEWMNVTVLRNWTYAESMPRLELAGFEIGLSPLLQWLLLPPLALALARRGVARPAPPAMPWTMR